MTIELNFETITWKIENRLGQITINRPDKLNALNSQVLNDLKKLLEEVAKLDFETISALYISGAGEKAFIAGADISEMAAMSSEMAKNFGELGQSVTLAIEALKIPTFACVNGFALGGGCEMAMACDFILATENAVFGQPEVKLGLIPGFGGTQRLSRRIGSQKALDLILTGRNMKIDEAVNSGLVLDRFSSKEEMIERVLKMAGQINKASPLAVQASKSAVLEGYHLSMPDALALELSKFSFVFSTDDMKEGCQAFVEKRPAQFKGR